MSAIEIIFGIIGVSTVIFNFVAIVLILLIIKNHKKENKKKWEEMLWKINKK